MRSQLSPFISIAAALAMVMVSQRARAASPEPLAPPPPGATASAAPACDPSRGPCPTSDVPRAPPPPPPAAVVVGPEAQWPVPPPPRPFHEEIQQRKSLAIAGLCVFGGVYLLNAILGGFVAGEPWLAAPVIGPFGYAASTYSYSNGANDRMAMLFFALDGLAQAAGIVMGIVGLATTTTVKVYDDKPTFSVVPTFSRDQAGMMAVAHF